MGMTFFRCPHCGQSLGSRGGLRNNLAEIGPPITTCSRCGKHIMTGAQEWAVMDTFSKLKIWAEVYAYYGLLVGPILGVAVWAGIVDGLKQSETIGIIAGTASWFLIVLRSHTLHKKEVLTSLQRKPLNKQRGSPTT